jgi:glyoxylase-like metal-dependent hydrolase (beta-lactamase superfamily II)
VTRTISGILVFAALAAAVTHAQQPKLSRAEEAIVARSMEQPQPSAYPVQMPPDVKLEVLPVLGNVFLLAGAKSNVVVQIGEEGTFVVDTATADRSDEIVKAIKVLTNRPISYLVNTSFDPDHFGGNEKLSDAGQNPTLNAPNLTGPGSRQAGGFGGGGGQPGRQQGAIIFAHENTLNRMSAPTGEKAAYPTSMWPTNTFFTDKKTMWFNDEPVELIHAPAAYTDGDVMVFFRHSDVIATGDVINTTGYAPFDPKRGGSIAGVLSALNDVIDIAVPRFNQQGGTRIVPGHGRILNEADVVEYRDMITIIHDRVKLGIDKGMTLAQIKAQQPTLDYDGLYSTRELTGDMYVEAIYNDLMKSKGPSTATRR